MKTQFFFVCVCFARITRTNHTMGRVRKTFVMFPDIGRAGLIYVYSANRISALSIIFPNRNSRMNSFKRTA